MRLLKRNDDGSLSLATFVGDDIPQRYAILSHRWEAEEVLFADLNNGTDKNKAGYKKILFCAEQARRDNLQYFWVDTCCIDKSSSTELAEAINSMFRWYRESTKCYVYLSDVSRSPAAAHDNLNERSWEAEFRDSQWFTRGWTLQELVAPVSVEFFSDIWEPLGNKASLERHICEITEIPVKALRGSPLSDFTVSERMRWVSKRVTTCPEDKAYSMLGIFGVHMSLIYAEGEEHAFKRLQEEIDKASKGVKREDFSIAFSLAKVPEIENFVAREEELSKMHDKLSGSGSRQTVVLCGLGGIGKTQLSIAYAKRYKNNYSGIFWLNIKDEYSLRQSFVNIAGQILQEHPSASRISGLDMKGNIDEVVSSVKAWLSLANNAHWLMIYDNYDNPKVEGNADPIALDIQTYLPGSYQGSVIITTRSSQVRIGHCIQVRKLVNIDDSLDILSDASRREGLRNNPDAITLALELDGLPLALATAGAYLDQVAVSLSDYLRLYKESWARLQEISPKLSSYEDRMLCSTWQISFNQVEKRNLHSANLLRLWAYFDSQDLWLELLQHGDSQDPDWKQELVKDELKFHDAVRVLCDYGLVEVNTSSQELAESRGYSIHACVHLWTIHVLNQEWNDDLVRVAVKCVGAHVPSEQDLWPWPTQRRLLQHAARCSQMFLSGSVMDIGLERYFEMLGNLYNDQGKLVEAEQMSQRALQGYEKALGAEHISTLRIISNIGILYQNQGKLVEAELMYQRALQGYEKALGVEHILSLETVNNLGILYQNQGKLVEAEQMHQRALQGYEKALGVENTSSHISALNSFWGLGNLFELQADMVNAREMYSKALAGYERLFGPDLPKSQILQDKLRALDAARETNTVEGVNAPMDRCQAQPSHASNAGTLSRSKRRKLLRKLGLR